MRETMNKWKMLGALTLAVGLVLVGTANATDQNLTNDGQNGNVAMAVAPDNAIHVVWARDTGAPPSGSDYKDVIYYMKSTDGGATWSAMKPISYAGAQVESQSVQVPSIAVDSVGKLHVVWHGTDPLNPPPGGSVQAAIGYVSSSDGGDTWTTQVNIAPNWGGGHPRIKVDPSDNNMIYVVWDDGGTSADFTRSTDGGSVWEAPRCINHPSGSGLPCHKPDIAIGPDGTLHVTMVGNSETLSPLGNIYYRFSTDQGVTWSGSQADLIYTAITPDGFHFATIEANSAGTIQVVTRDNFVNLHPDLNNTHKLGYLYYLEKPASGAWSTPVQITSGKTRDQWGGWKEEMILDPSNNLYLVYSQVTDVTAGRDVYLMKYNKVPGTWGPEVRLTDASGTQGNPQVARDSNGNLHVVYLDYGQSDIHYISLPPQTEVWVDDDWAGTATGTEVEPGKIFGYNAFATIQEGIDNVAGSTINVAAGKYDGFNVPVGKDNLTIQSISGAEVTTIVLGDKGEGGSSGTPPYGESYTEESEAVLGLTPGSLVTIKANGVTINGFTVTAGDDKGISVWECDSVEIKNCIFRDNTGSLNARGIQLAYSNHCVIQDNEFQNNTIGFCAFFSDNNTIQNNNLSGSHFIIYIQGGEGNTVQDNIIPEGYFGIRVEVGSSAPGEPATNNIIKGNTLNSSYAITIWNGATENTVENNNVNSIFQGVEISSGVGGGAPSPNNIVRGNDISVWAWDGVEKCDYGVALWGGDGNIVEDNSITKSEFAGIHVKASGNAIQSNNVFNNDVGMLIEDPATNNAIHFNNIAENSDYGLNNITAEEVSATNNWWGSTTGPYQATTNSHGTGDAVSDDVDFVPWLDASGGNATGGLPATLLLSASETSVVVGGNTSLITATLTDAIGNPIADSTIDYGVTTGDGTLSPASGTTDDWGHDTTRFASPTLAEINTVTGWYRPDSTITASVNIDVTPGPLARVETTPADTHVVVVGDVNIVAELMDTYHNHIDATDTSEVSFATTGLGTIGVTSVTADDKIQMVYTTDDSMATDTITATTTTGNYTDFSVVTTYGAAPATMTFKATDSKVVVSDTTATEALSIALFDQYGNPSAYSDYDASEMYKVIFTWSSGAGIIKPNIAAVNANGCCGVIYKSSTVVGNYTVTATSGDATASLVITQTHDVLAAVSLTPDTASCVGGQDVTLTAELLDRFANHIDAIDVGDVTPNLLTGRGILGTPSLDTIANVVKVVYTTYISEADTAEIEATATTFKDTSVVISALAGTLDHFALALDTDSLNVGTAVTVTITAEDIDSVRIYTYDNDDIIALTLDGTAAEASQVMWVIGTDTSYALTAEIPESTFAAGQVDITIVNKKAEAVTVAATDIAGITGTSDAITWIPITLDHFGIVVQTEPIYTGVPFTFTVIPYDEYENVTSVGLPVWWIIFGTNEPGIDLPSEPLEFNAITDYFATASNASTSLILTVGTTDGLIHGISDTITVIGLYTLSGTVGLADNPGDLSGTEVMVTGGFSDTTDAIGYYEIAGLLSGTYNIIVTHEGYHTIIESGVDISANIVKNFVLQPVITGIEEIPTVYSLSQNKPNPFAGGTTIEYGLPKAGNVEIVVYNAAGQKVRTLVSAEEKAGYHKVSWDVTNDSGAKVGGGIYFYKITAGEFTSLKKLILLK